MAFLSMDNWSARTAKFLGSGQKGKIEIHKQETGEVLFNQA